MYSLLAAFLPHSFLFPSPVNYLPTNPYLRFCFWGEPKLKHMHISSNFYSNVSLVLNIPLLTITSHFLSDTPGNPDLQRTRFLQINRCFSDTCLRACEWGRAGGGTEGRCVFVSLCVCVQGDKNGRICLCVCMCVCLHVSWASNMVRGK